jgi:hypothetical protein
MRLSLLKLDEFQEHCRDLENVDVEVNKSLGAYVPRFADDIWNSQGALKYATTRLERGALAGAKVDASASKVTMQGGTSPSVKGIRPQVDFGTKDKSRTTTYTRRSVKGLQHQVTRRTRAQLPDYRKQGALYRSMKESERRFSSLIVQTIVRTLHDVLERK